MATTSEILEAIKADLDSGKKIAPVSVRDFLSWFDAQRRGSSIVWWIRYNLRRVGLVTQPDFEAAYLDSSITFEIAPDLGDIPSAEQVAEDEISSISNVETSSESSRVNDPTYRISKLAAANKAPLFVTPNATKQEAVTLMLAHDFSQLPVMTTEREVKGIISWTSIGSRLALGKDGDQVNDLMDNHQEIRADASMFQAIPIIVQYQYVLVRGPDNRITGIVTATDLSVQFQQLSEPFLLLSEIENYIRLILVDKFSVEELSAARDPSDADWPAPGSEDTELGVFMGPEVSHGEAKIYARVQA